jgi:hypothetical protein
MRCFGGAFCLLVHYAMRFAAVFCARCLCSVSWTWDLEASLELEEGNSFVVNRETEWRCRLRGARLVIQTDGWAGGRVF